MKAFVIVEEGYEYNDEYYTRPENPGRVEEKGFLDRTAAQDVCDRLNGKLHHTVRDFVTEDGLTINPYKVVEVEIPE